MTYRGSQSMLFVEKELNSILFLSKDNAQLPESGNYSFGSTVVKMQGLRVSQQRFVF